MSRYKASYQNDTIVADLIFAGYPGDVNDISETLSLMPTTKANKGEKRSPNGSYARESFWRYTLEGSADDEPEDILNGLLTLLKPKYDAIRKLSESCSVRVGIGSTRYAYNQEFFINPVCSQALASINATLWIDAYCLPETYLEEKEQQNNLITLLSTSKSAEKLGLNASKESKAVVDVLANIESLTDDIFEDMFPDYASGDPASNEDIEKALNTARRKINELNRLIEKADFFSDQ